MVIAKFIITQLIIASAGGYVLGKTLRHCMNDLRKDINSAKERKNESI